jgi:nitrogen-specific signal transduction histidine kinase
MTSTGKHFSWMAVTFSPDGVIRSVAPGDAHLFPHPASELVGCHITHLLAVTSVLKIPHMIQAARKSGFWQGEIFLRTGDSRSFPASGRLAAISGMDTEGETLLLLSMSRVGETDPGVSCNLYEVGARLREIAHQLNNPLAVMMGYAQLVLMDIPAEGRIRADVELIFEQTQKIAGLVEKLRDYGAALQGESQMQPGGTRS